MFFVWSISCEDFIFNIHRLSFLSNYLHRANDWIKTLLKIKYIDRYEICSTFWEEGENWSSNNINKIAHSKGLPTARHILIQQHIQHIFNSGMLRWGPFKFPRLLFELNVCIGKLLENFFYKKATKGQLISKGPFGVIVWTKNPTNFF